MDQHRTGRPLTSYGAGAAFALLAAALLLLAITHMLPAQASNRPRPDQTSLADTILQVRAPVPAADDPCDGSPTHCLPCSQQAASPAALAPSRVAVLVLPVLTAIVLPAPAAALIPPSAGFRRFSAPPGVPPPAAWTALHLLGMLLRV